MAAQDKLEKLQQFQRTQQLIHDLNLEKATQLPSAAGAEGVSNPAKSHAVTSFLLNRTRDSVSRHDMTLIREHLKVFSELDPANPYYSTLLERINHGEHITWKDFEQALNRFSSNEYYMVKLQDEINNAKLAETGETPTEVTETDERPSSIVDLPSQPEKPAEETPPSQSQQPVAPHIEALQAPKRPIFIQRPSAFTKQTEEKLNKANQSMQKAQKEIRTQSPSAPQSSEKLSDRLNSATRAIRVSHPQPPPSATRIRSAKPPAVISSRKRQAPQQQKNEDNKNKALGLLKKGPGPGGLNIPWVPKFLQNAARNLLRNAVNLGSRAISSLARGAFNLGSRALAQLLPRAGLQAGMAAGRGLLFSAGGTAAAVVSSAIFWWILAVVGLFTFIWWWDQFIGNSECEKPTGEMRIVKRLGGVGSLEVDPSKIEAAIPNGQKMDFVIEASYQLACRTRTLSSVVVTDRVPEGTEYIEGSATAGFYQTNGEPVKGVYDSNTRTITWSFTNFPMSNPVYIYFSAQPDPNTIDTWVMNEATVRFTESGRTGLGGGTGGVIDAQSASLEAVIAQAAQRVGMEPALMKAFIRVEAPQTLKYSEEEFRFFSTPGWWEGLEANASTLPGNDPTIIRGYAYNTCAYTSCAPGADVRGVTQFELRTWNGVASQLQFADGHTPDRRNATDAIFGSALHNRQNAEIYTGSSNVEWTEDVVKAAGRVYCAGPAAAKNPARVRDSACMQGGVTYDDLLWQYYLEYRGGQQ